MIFQCFIRININKLYFNIDYLNNKFILRKLTLMKLIIFSNNVDIEENSESETNKPVERKHKILERLNNNVENIFIVYICEMNGLDRSILIDVHDSDYLHFL